MDKKALSRKFATAALAGLLATGVAACDNHGFRHAPDTTPGNHTSGNSCKGGGSCKGGNSCKGGDGCKGGGSCKGGDGCKH